MIQTPALLLGSCMALGKVLSLSGPGISHWESRAMAVPHGAAVRMSELIVLSGVGTQ